MYWFQCTALEDMGKAIPLTALSRAIALGVKVKVYVGAHPSSPGGPIYSVGRIV